ncbi:MAG: wax ester/triacylglycerol synthase family O-acyltransferase [Actinomycetia bacterium]|nr:wax ester/triacylglycerol synthase family O-acyltransferase [Actinomycetes bacterium]
MKQLSGLDASFLNLETRTTVGHVAGLSIYERPNDDFEPYAAVYERVGSMIGHVPPLRRRLVEVPFKLDHPWWIDDPHFDLDYHIRHLGLAPPGAADQLANQVARISSRHLDRSRPLWELYVIEGLGDGRWATLWKTHHATIDGASGVILMNMLTDTTPEGEPIESLEWTPDEEPTEMEMLSHTIKSLAMSPLKAARLQVKLARILASKSGISAVTDQLADLQDRLRSASGEKDHPRPADRVSLPLTPAPPTPWNEPISAARRFAMRSTSLENLKRLKTAVDGSVNDVVMAICAGALRSYLIKHDSLPEGPLRAMVPVSIRTGDEADPWTNRVSSIVCDLPTHLDDPLERFSACQVAMANAKHQLDLVPADTLIDIAQTASPVVATAATRLVSRLAGRVNLPVNVVISNVPGPRVPLYLEGARLDNYIPVSMVTDGVGLNITVHSYLDRLDFGLISDRELIPDLWDLVDMHVDEIEVLFEATGAEWAEPPGEPALRIGEDG